MFVTKMEFCLTESPLSPRFAVVPRGKMVATPPIIQENFVDLLNSSLSVGGHLRLHSLTSLYIALALYRFYTIMCQSIQLRRPSPGEDTWSD